MVFKLFESHEKWTNGSILQLNAEEIEQEVILTIFHRVSYR